MQKKRVWKHLVNIQPSDDSFQSNKTTFTCNRFVFFKCRQKQHTHTHIHFHREITFMNCSRQSTFNIRAATLHFLMTLAFLVTNRKEDFHKNTMAQVNSSGSNIYSYTNSDLDSIVPKQMSQESVLSQAKRS